MRPTSVTIISPNDTVSGVGSISTSLQHFHYAGVESIKVSDFNTVTLVTPSLQKQGNTAHGLHKMAVCGDIHIEVPAVPFRELFSKRPGTSSTDMSKKIKEAREYADSPAPVMDLSDGCMLLMKQAYDELGMTPRSMHTIIRVARTIANLAGVGYIHEEHLCEAIQYRLLDRKY